MSYVQGLKVAPPEAPTTGYMFGKGVYFADMSSKSANYCFTNRQVWWSYLPEVLRIQAFYPLGNTRYPTTTTKEEGEKISCPSLRKQAKKKILDFYNVVTSK
jgi:hypothetical protein